MLISLAHLSKLGTIPDTVPASSETGERPPSQERMSKEAAEEGRKEMSKTIQRASATFIFGRCCHRVVHIVDAVS